MLLAHVICDKCGCALAIETRNLTNGFYRRWWLPEQGWKELPRKADGYGDKRRLRHLCPRCKLKDPKITEELPPVETGPSVGEQVMLTVNGQRFRCVCNCNVFTKLADGTYKCNACKAQYSGE